MLDENSADMTPEARTERLYWFLRNMGFVVEPEMKDGRWCALRVAVELPALAAQVSKPYPKINTANPDSGVFA